MRSEEIVIDGFASAKAFFDAVPEADAILAELPAQAHLTAAVEGEKIDEADVQVLDHRAGELNPVEGVLKSGGAGVAARAERQIRGAVDAGAAGSADVIDARIEPGVGALIFGFMKDGVAQGGFKLGEEALAFLEPEVSRHSSHCGKTGAQPSQRRGATCRIGRRGH